MFTHAYTTNLLLHFFSLNLDLCLDSKGAHEGHWTLFSIGPIKKKLSAFYYFFHWLIGIGCLIFPVETAAQAFALKTLIAPGVCIIQHLIGEEVADHGG